MKRFRLMTGLAVTAACAYGDWITWVATPTVARVSQTSSVTVAYSVDEPSAGKALYVGVSQAQLPNKWLGVARRPVSGTGTATIAFRVDAPPADGSSYSLMARVVRELDGPAVTTAEASERPVTVIADRIEFLVAIGTFYGGPVFSPPPYLSLKPPRHYSPPTSEPGK